MKYYLYISFIFLFNTIQAQDVLTFSQKDFLKSATNIASHNLWWHEDMWFPKGDTLPYFVDDRNYKGILNYGVKIYSRDKRNLTFIENRELYYLNVIIEKASFNKKDSIINVQGVVNGGWDGENALGNGFKNKPNNAHIFIGQRRDTLINLRYLNKRSDEEYKVVYNNKEVKQNNFIMLDTFPSFYMYNFVHTKTNKGRNRKFNITAKINSSSVMTIGLEYCYSINFDLGKMVYDPDSFPNYNSSPLLEIVNKYDVIIRNNVQVKRQSDDKKVVKPDYYQITKVAEDFIIQRKYKEASLKYLELHSMGYSLFGRDIHNAILSAIIARDSLGIKTWLRQLAIKGISMSYFNNNSIFKRIKNKPIWTEFLEEYPDLNKEFRDKSNNELIAGLQYLVKMDQEAYYKNTINQIEREELFEITESIDKSFIDLVKKYGFPSERKIGIPQDSLGNIQSIPFFSILFIHSMQSSSRHNDCMNEIRMAAINDLNYDGYNDHYDLFFNNGNTCFKIYKKAIYHNKSCKMDLKELAKVKFSLDNPYGFLIYSNKVTTIPYDLNDESEDKQFLSEMYYLIK